MLLGDPLDLAKYAINHVTNADQYQEVEDEVDCGKHETNDAEEQNDDHEHGNNDDDCL
jgi:hypothetical protein